jgi:catechol 2,3-dioxygenase-like lactoylglutathione lyase family enzyme
MLTVARYGTRDLARARTFYDAIAEMIGARLVIDRPDLAGYKGPDGGTFLVGVPFEGEASVGNGTQVGFAVSSRADVDAIYAKALELGGASEGAPGVRGPDPDGFYGAYFRDLDGNKLVAFRFGPI